MPNNLPPSIFSFYLFLIIILSFSTIDAKSPPHSKEYSNNYEVISIVPDSNKIIILANYTGTDLYYKDPLNPILQQLQAEIFLQADNELRVLIKDSQNIRWEIPQKDPYPHDKESHYIYDLNSVLYKVEIKSKPFAFRIIRVATKEVLFNTQYFNLICSDRYFEFSSSLPTENIFGIGERVYKLKLQIPGLYTIWNRDLPSKIDDAESGALNTYGLYPLHLMREKSGHFHLVYLRNSNGMDVFLNNTIIRDKKGRFHELKTITYKITGGVIDLKFFLGGDKKSPEEVIKMYHSYLGGYTLQAFWSFGFHQCRWGYHNLTDLNTTLANYHEYGMPLDTIWMDIDYMVSYQIFTIDEKRYNLTTLEYLLEKLYQKRLVLIIDPGVAVKEGYIPYDKGMQMDIFIKDHKGDPLLACVWPGQTHFPDFMNNKTQSYWNEMFDLLYAKVNFSGIWLDMNELSNFVDGEVGPGECGMIASDEPVTKAMKLNETIDFIFEFVQNNTNITVTEAYERAVKTLRFEPKNTPPAQEKCGYSPEDYFYVYNPGNTKLDKLTVCLNGKHDDGTYEYNVHNFNGLFEAMNTYNYLKDSQKQSQPFILSRSTAPGSGKFTTHWTGDNVSTFKWMKVSIAGLINFNMYGIPNVGADICGFALNTTEELCSRWIQLGALYPFSRNHNSIDSIDQDPFAFGETLIKTSMKSLKFRYSILKYYYSLFVRNNGTGTVMRPLFFEFPEDKKNYLDDVLDKEFLIGSNLLVTPVLEQGIIHIRPYFPSKKTIWYDIKTGKAHQGGKKHYITNTLKEAAPIFLRSGRSIYRQNVDSVTRTYDLDNVFYFSVALRKERRNRALAQGEIMACEDYHNYEKLEKCLNGDCMLNVVFKLQKKNNKLAFTIKIKGEKDRSSYDLVYLSGVELYGVEDMLTNCNSTVIVEKVNYFNNRWVTEPKIGFAKKSGEIVRVDFGMSLSMQVNDIIIIKFN